MDQPQPNAVSMPAVSMPAAPGRRGGAKGRKIRRPSRILKDLRWAYLNPEEPVATEAKKRLQRLFRDSPKVFIAQLSAAERAHAAGAAKVEKKEALVEPTAERTLGPNGSGR